MRAERNLKHKHLIIYPLKSKFSIKNAIMHQLETPVWISKQQKSISIKHDIAYILSDTKSVHFQRKKRNKKKKTINQ